MAIAALLIFRSGLLDPLGKPVGADFLAFYAGSQLALEGKAQAAYDYPTFHKTQTDIIEATPPPLFWLYPPSFFLVILPLSLFPYIISWLVWLFLTGAGYLAVMRKIFPDSLTLTVAIAFPGTIQNIIQGQNGFLSTIFIGGGLILLPSRPFYAGILLGMMTYKPHLSFLLPVALLASRHWLALGGFMIGAVSLIASSTIVLGADIWIIYIKNILYATQVLQSDVAPLYKAPTTYAFAILLGANVVIARILQATVSVFVLATIIWLWSRSAVPHAEKAAGLAVGIFLFTPSVYDYDLAILAVAIAFTARELMYHGGRFYEKWILVAVWVLPLAFPIVAAASNLQIGPLILALFFGLNLWRAAAALKDRKI